MSTPDRKALLDPEHPALSIRRQCAMLGIARSGLYRPPPAANDDDLALMRRMGITALAPKPRTTKPAPGDKIFPYLLCGVVIDRHCLLRAKGSTASACLAPLRCAPAFKLFE